MRIKIKFFAILKEKFGREEMIKEVAEGTTVAALWDSLRREHPQLAQAKLRLLYAVNRNYVEPDYVLKERDEIVFIPPVSGG
jgi:molybdopterin converting factor subunit 1